MAVDGDPSEPGGDAFENGVGDEQRRKDELAARRADREAAETGASASIAERAAGGEADAEETLFPLGALAGDPKRTVKNLIRAGVPVELTAKMRAVGVPLQGGFLPDDAELQVLVTLEPGAVTLVPIREPDSRGERKVTKYKAVQQLRPSFVQSTAGLIPDENVAEMLRKVGASEAKIAELLGWEIPEAGTGS